MSNEPTQNAEPQQPAGDDQERSPSSDAAPKSTSIPPTEASAGAASSSDDNGATENENGGEAKAEGEGGAPAPGEKKKRRRRKKKKGGGAGVEGAQATGAEGQAHPQHQNHNQHQKKKDRRPQESRERPAFGLGDVVFGKIVEITEDVLFIDLSGKAHAVFDRREMLLPEEPAQGPGSDVEEDDFDPGDLVAAPDPSSATPPPPEAAAEVSAVDAAQAAQDEQAKESRRIVTPKASEEPKPEEEAKAEEPAPPPTQHSPTESVSLAAAPIVVTLPPVVLEVGANFVGVVHNDGGRGGLVVLTRHPRRGRKRKMDVAKALREKTTVEGLVTGVIKGGIEVDIDGLRAFAPASHVALHHGSRLQELLGLRLPFFVTQYAKRGTDIVLSRKSMLEAEAKGKREEALKHLVVGNAIVGTVRSVVPFGAFIDIGGIEGLVPLAEMSHNRGDSPGDVFHVNQQVEVLLQRIDAKGKIWLSRKAVLPDPWGEVAKKYADGTRHKGRVARLQPFGAFVELEPGIDGLIHTSDLGTSDKKIDKPEDVVKVGDEIEVFVVSLDVGSHKIGLSPVPPNWPEGQPFMRVGLHRAVRVKVTAYDANGLFVQILGATGRQSRGYIAAGGTGTPRGTDLRKAFAMNSEHDAKVIEMDPRRNEVKLSIRALAEDTERNAYKSYKQQVKAEAKFGTLGDLLKKSQERK
ncbi:MAG TPA: S1 RNA-binding domain-containing protein [Polyangiaceae bacterium]|jgi:small subunit ribosomal protein S1